ncbi:hypothetical protein Tco_1398051 [Tanacetum coccineum]
MLEIKVYKMGGQEEIFTSEAWRNAFDINEPIYTELCHDFYSTYEFDEEVTNEELIKKKLIKFRLGRRAHSLTFDEHFNARENWLSISSEEELYLSRGAASTIRSLVLRVLQKMITYGLCQKTNIYDKIQKNELWLMSMFEAGHQNWHLESCYDLDSPRPTMQILYDMMGNMEIRQGVLEKDGAYAPPGYDEGKQQE